mmetsp:Transcript_24508/g.35972  ORF Transcript_24508/g.35972 Transcript_24508/m.35972 type:complete len:89 (+) Transcript_24508:1059-1325(+)
MGSRKVVSHDHKRSGAIGYETTGLLFIVVVVVGLRLQLDLGVLPIIQFLGHNGLLELLEGHDLGVVGSLAQQLTDLFDESFREEALVL